MLIVTADDYGSSRSSTDNTLECCLHRRVTSASSMMFMIDSERAAALARESGMEIGLHLNFTSSLTGRSVPPTLREHHDKIMRYLAKSRFAWLIYNPRLANAFRYSYMCQIAEFSRLYGRDPQYFNGHHHMHLCANILLGQLLPSRAAIRRTFTAEAQERSWPGQPIREWIAGWIRKRFVTTVSFYSIEPIADTNRLTRIVGQAANSVVEIEVHPESEAQTRFLLSEQYKKMTSAVIMGRFGDIAY